MDGNDSLDRLAREYYRTPYLSRSIRMISMILSESIKLISKFLTELPIYPGLYISIPVNRCAFWRERMTFLKKSLSFKDGDALLE